MSTYEQMKRESIHFIQKMARTKGFVQFEVNGKRFAGAMIPLEEGEELSSANLRAFDEYYKVLEDIVEAQRKLQQISGKATHKFTVPKEFWVNNKIEWRSLENLPSGRACVVTEEQKTEEHDAANEILRKRIDKLEATQEAIGRDTISHEHNIDRIKLVIDDVQDDSNDDCEKVEHIMDKFDELEANQKTLISNQKDMLKRLTVHFNELIKLWER